MSIEFRHISKSFGTKKVLRDLSFTVKKGEILFILGRSGMGKSVTLKLLVGLLQPDTGEIWIENENLMTASAAQTQMLRRKCGMVFQHPALLDSLSVYDNIAFGLRGRPTDEIRKIVLEKLALVQLGPEILNRLPSQISYGMQKRVSLARTLAPNPQYLLFDEPTTGLDPITTNAINNLILELSRKLSVTCMVVSHDMNCAIKIADSVLVLDQGKILVHTSVAELKTSEEPMIKAFLEGISL
jgi:phospholipid/cholesterol/gamma-HCH transport system ATP-binding protein